MKPSQPFLAATPRQQSTTAMEGSVLSVLAGILIAGCLLVVAPLVAQDEFDTSGFGQSGDLFGGIKFGGLGELQDDPVTWSARYYTRGDQGRLEIEAIVGRSWHIYSTTQPPGGPLATSFTIRSPKSVSISGGFRPDEPPSHSVSDLYPGVTIEEHQGTVKWSAPIKVSAGFEGEIKVAVVALTCQNGGSCLPADETLTAIYAGALTDEQVASGNDQARDDQARDDQAHSAADNAAAADNADQAHAISVATQAVKLLAEPSARTVKFRDKEYDVTWTAGVSSSITAGGSGHLIFRASPEADYHVYQGVVDDSESSTNFVVTQKNGLRVGRPVTDQPIITKSLFPSIPGIPDTPPVKYYKGEVTWSLPFQVPAELAAGDYEIQGLVCYQACTDKSCLQPMAFQFSAIVNVSAQADPNLRPIEIKSTKFAAAIDQAGHTDWVDEISITDTAQSRIESDEAIAVDPAQTVAAAATEGGTPQASLPFILLLALCGGFILNFMPCVLPVIGIKVLSFVQQAGEDRRRVALLNFSYVGGILAVFAVLAVLAVVFSLGWGEHFAYFPVRIGLTILIFSLALSYLGVWELPTPGVATGKTSDELQKKEGLPGAFFTGAFATLLATPCSGPFLGVALGYTLYLSSAASAAVIMTVGLGMSLPYILLGLFPSAVGWLPKPGNWMVTLKELMGFLFLGTVAFFFNQFNDGQKLPVFVTLIGVWFGCWVIGKVPPWESLHKRIRGWTIGIASAVMIGWLGFYYLERNADPFVDANNVQFVVDDHVRWERYDESRLQEHLADGRTVMLDFTAEWCASCKVNTAFALDTESTGQLLQNLDAVPMLADMTDMPEHILSKLKGEFGSKSIPLLVIYPGSAPNQPIVLRDLVTQSMVIDALNQAGPSLKPYGTVKPQVSGGSRSQQSLTSLDSTRSDVSVPPRH